MNKPRNEAPDGFPGCLVIWRDIGEIMSKTILDWLKRNWARVTLSLLIAGAVALWIVRYAQPGGMKLIVAILGVAAIASWWVGWPDEEA